MSIRFRAFSRLVLVMGLAIWLTIAVFNNLADPQTNRLLLGQTLSMELLKPEPVLGSGLTWRALPADWSHSWSLPGCRRSGGHCCPAVERGSKLWACGIAQQRRDVCTRTQPCDFGADLLLDVVVL